MTGLGSSCGACKFLRRKCSSECVFAPYFCYDEAPSNFAAVHKVFGASNVSKLLLHLPLHNRSDAASTISYEALARMRDPIYGCVAHIFALQQQVAYLQEEIEIVGNQIASRFNCGVTSWGSSEATARNNINAGAQLLPQHNAINSPFYQISQEILLSTEAENSEGNTAQSQAFDGLTGLFPSYDFGEENVFCQSLSNPLELEGLFERTATELDNFVNSSCLNDNPIMETCIGPIWD